MACHRLCTERAPGTGEVSPLASTHYGLDCHGSQDSCPILLSTTFLPLVNNGLPCCLAAQERRVLEGGKSYTEAIHPMVTSGRW